MSGNLVKRPCEPLTSAPDQRRLEEEEVVAPTNQERDEEHAREGATECYRLRGKEESATQSCRGQG